MSKSHFLLVALLATTQAAAGSPAPERLNLTQSLRLALEVSPDYDVARRNESNASLAYRNAWAALLPHADVELGHAYTLPGGSSPTTLNTFPSQSNSAWSNIFTLGVSENLYDNGDSWRLKNIADLNREIGRLTRERRKQQLLLDVMNAFYAYSASAGQLDLQRQEIEALRLEFRTIHGRYREGVKSNRDYLRIKAQLARSEIDFSTQEIALESAKQKLRVAIGSQTDLEFEAYAPSSQQLEAITFPRVSAADSLDYQIAKTSDQISDLKYTTVSRNEWPRLSLKASYSYNQPQYLGPPLGQGADSSYWTFQTALVLDYALWDWGLRHRNVAIADNQRWIEKDAQVSVRLQVAQSLRQLENQTELYVHSYRASLLILRDQQNVYESLNRGYRDGTVSYLELITALGDLFQARSQAMNLGFNLLNQQASFAFYQGNLDEVLGLP